MQIKVSDTYQYPYYVSVKVDGFCNHYGENETTSIETEYGYSRNVVLCSNCRAEWNELDNRWITNEWN